MVLLFNVFLTNSPANPNIYLDRGNLPIHDKVSIVKYSLHSLSKLYDWKRVIIKIELDSQYASEENSLRDYVHQLFQGKDIVYSNKRNKFQKDWIDTYTQINDEFVLYLGNHDHIFMDSSTEYFTNLIANVKKSNLTNPSFAISHWPESIRSSKSGYIELNELHPRKLNENYTIHDSYITYNTTCIDSLLIITKSLYKNWFLEGVWGDYVELPRTEGIGKYTLGNIKKYLNQELPKQTMVVPYKELFRHFDGYMHQMIDNDVCPSLSIPEGFFESQIKIRYGYDDRKEGWVNINPKANHFFAKDTTGVDYKFTLDDIPFFWKDRIVELDINKEVDEEEMIQHKLHTILKMMYSDYRYNPYIDLEIEKKVLYCYLKSHKNYKLD
jgi:hypothetical protein